jgi:hypothetical protein
MTLMQNGASFAVVCEALADASSSSDQAASIGRSLTRWLADGVIASAGSVPRLSSHPPTHYQDTREMIGRNRTLKRRRQRPEPSGCAAPSKSGARYLRQLRSLAGLDLEFYA